MKPEDTIICLIDGNRSIIWLIDGNRSDINVIIVGFFVNRTLYNHLFLLLWGNYGRDFYAEVAWNRKYWFPTRAVISKDVFEDDINNLYPISLAYNIWYIARQNIL